MDNKVSMRTIAQSVWLRAWRQEGALELICPTPKEAARMRFALYNAVKGLKEAEPGDPRFPRELVEAVQGLTVQLDGSTVRLVKHADTAIGAVMLAAAQGIEVLSVEDQAADEAAKRLEEKLLRGGEAEVRATPYYTREK